MASGHNTDAELNTLQLQVLLLHKGPLGRVTGYAAKKFLGMRGDSGWHRGRANDVNRPYQHKHFRRHPFAPFVAEESSCFREVQPLGRVGTRLCPACNISTSIPASATFPTIWFISKRQRRGGGRGLDLQEARESGHGWLVPV